MDMMGIPILLDDIIDLSAVLDRIWCVRDDHVRCLTCGVDMDISKSEKSLEDPSRMSIYLLDSIERTLSYTTRESGYLLDSDHTRVSNDKKIELIVDPIEEDKREKSDPKNRKSSPVEGFVADDFYDDGTVLQKKPAREEKSDKIEKMVYKYNPMTVERHDYFFIFSEEWDMFFFDHVIWGAFM